MRVVDRVRDATHVVIGTHSGVFHCDEIMAIAMLKLIPEFAAADVLRTRQPELLAACAVVVDVGGQYCAERGRFDHHQRGFHHTMPGCSTKLSSAGLIFLHYGHHILRHLHARVVETDVEHAEREQVVAAVFPKVYKSFLEFIDAVDNGAHAPGQTTLTDRVAAMNPQWNDPHSDAEIQRRFAAAVHLASVEFLHAVRVCMHVWWPARLVIAHAYADRFAVHASGRIMVLTYGCPWKEHLQFLEHHRQHHHPHPHPGDPPGPAVQYVVFPDDSGASWRVQAVSASAFGKPSLPQAWAGHHGDTLRAITGIDGCIFVHATGYIGGNETMDGAIRMALGGLAPRGSCAPP